MDAAKTDTGISEEQWREIDQHLFDGHPVTAVQSIWNFGRPTLQLKHAIDMMHDRYTVLRADYPEQFVEDASTYWEKVMC